MLMMKLVRAIILAYTIAVGMVLGWLLTSSGDIVGLYILIPEEIILLIDLVVIILPALVMFIIWFSFDTDNQLNAGLRQLTPLLPLLIASYVVAPDVIRNEYEMGLLLIAIFLLGIVLVYRLPRDHQQIRILLFGYLGLPLADIVAIMIEERQGFIEYSRLIISELAVFTIISLLLAAVTYLLEQHYTPISYLHDADKILYKNVDKRSEKL